MTGLRPLRAALDEDSACAMFGGGRLLLYVVVVEDVGKTRKSDASGESKLKDSNDAIRPQ